MKNHEKENSGSVLIPIDDLFKDKLSIELYFSKLKDEYFFSYDSEVLKIIKDLNQPLTIINDKLDTDIENIIKKSLYTILDSKLKISFIKKQEAKKHINDFIYSYIYIGSNLSKDKLFIRNAQIVYFIGSIINCYIFRFTYSKKYYFIVNKYIYGYLFNFLDFYSLFLSLLPLFFSMEKNYCTIESLIVFLNTYFTSLISILLKNIFNLSINKKNFSYNKSLNTDNYGLVLGNSNIKSNIFTISTMIIVLLGLNIYRNYIKHLFLMILNSLFHYYVYDKKINLFNLIPVFSNILLQVLFFHYIEII